MKRATYKKPCKYKRTGTDLCTCWDAHRMGVGGPTYKNALIYTMTHHLVQFTISKHNYCSHKTGEVWWKCKQVCAALCTLTRFSPLSSKSGCDNCTGTGDCSRSRGLILLKSFLRTGVPPFRNGVFAGKVSSNTSGLRSSPKVTLFLFLTFRKAGTLQFSWPSIDNEWVDLKKKLGYISYLNYVS